MHVDSVYKQVWSRSCRICFLYFHVNKPLVFTLSFRIRSMPATQLKITIYIQYIQTKTHPYTLKFPSLAFSCEKSVKGLIYIEVSTATTVQELFITFSCSRHDFPLSPWDANGLQMQMPPAGFPKFIPHKTINHCIPSCQVMDTSATKWAWEGEKNSFIPWKTVESTNWMPNSHRRDPN